MEDYRLKLENRDHIDIDLRGILREILKSWWLILIAGFLTAMGSYLVISREYQPVYRTSATLLITTKASVNSSLYSPNTDLATTIQMADTFTYIISSDIMKDIVASDLGTRDIPGEIQASVMPETNLMTLTVTSDNPRRTFQIMDSVLRNYRSVSELVIDNALMEVLEAPKVPMQAANAFSMASVLTKGFQAGFLVMTMLVGIAAYLRDTVKTEKDIVKKLDVPQFATVPHEGRRLSHRKLATAMKKKSLLVTGLTIGFTYAEAFKKIRTRLEYLGRKVPVQIVIITSSLPEEGKSTVSANLALSLAQNGRKVLLIDGDLKQPNLYRVLDIAPEGLKEFGDVLEGKLEYPEALTYHKAFNLHLLLGTRSIEKSSELLSGEKMGKILEQTRKDFDYIIIDTPPAGIVADAPVLTSNADIALLVVRQNFAKAKTINDTIDSMSRNRATLIGCIYNNVKSGRSTRSYGYTGKYGYHAKAQEGNIRLTKPDAGLRRKGGELDEYHEFES